MLTSFRLTAALSLTLLTLITGCSPESDSSLDPINETEDTPEKINSVKVVQKPEQPLTISAENPDATTQQKIQQYLNGLASKGFVKASQGVWMQTGDNLLANHQGTIPLPAASLTKVATALAALQTFGPDHQFVTLIGATGPIEDGVLKGDLVIQGGEDPFFVWEEAIALGNSLNQLGIQRVTGNLIISGKFYMNFATDPTQSGNLLRQGLNAQLWPSEAETQYRTLPPTTPRPQVIFAGSLQVSPLIPSDVQPLITHSSFPVAELVKKMNRYSNNKMAEMLANSVGGPQVVAQKAAEAAGVPPAEVQLINGSGLGVDNRISPRAVVAMFKGIERYLEPYQMNLADVFAVVGEDEGILDERQLPGKAVVKSGSLNDVSTLGGVLPTKEKGMVWFALMNGGSNNLKGFRTEQESLLQEFLNKWGVVQSLPAKLTPNPNRKGKTSSNEIENLR
ncbi:MAG: D-alanyl-D-alanine carboxypeptidase [Coleofasciculaceae cyanobacterium]